MRKHIRTVPQFGTSGALLVAMILATGCGGSGDQPGAEAGTGTTAAAVQINGAGATFPYPIYSKWFDAYTRLHPNARINYQSIGSGGGIRQMIAGTVFFGATDGPMTEEQMAQAPGAIMHFPTVIGGVVPIYNITGVDEQLRFPAQVLAGMFLGDITKWNDPAIAAANPGVTLPDLDVVTVHRSDGSGTNYIFTDYLSTVSPEFQQSVGKGTSVSWPGGVGAKGNEGVSGLVKQTPGALGYVELIYATQNDIAFGAVENAAGNYVLASTETLTEAAAGAAEKVSPDDFRVSIVNAPGDNAYPISSFTWLLLYEKSDDTQRAETMVAFLKWALTDGQQYAPDLGYAPLPANVVQMEMQAIDQMQAPSSM